MPPVLGYGMAVPIQMMSLVRMLTTTGFSAQEI